MSVAWAKKKKKRMEKILNLNGINFNTGIKNILNSAIHSFLYSFSQKKNILPPQKCKKSIIWARVALCSAVCSTIVVKMKTERLKF